MSLTATTYYYLRFERDLEPDGEFIVFLAFFPFLVEEVDDDILISFFLFETFLLTCSSSLLDATFLFGLAFLVGSLLEDF